MQIFRINQAAKAFAAIGLIAFSTSLAGARGVNPPDRPGIHPVTRANGDVIWGSNPRPRPRDIKDTLPRRRNGADGLLEFYWTKNGDQHPAYEKYRDTNSSSINKRRRFRQPNDPTITDWKQLVGHVGKGKSVVVAGNLNRDGTDAPDRTDAGWLFASLDSLPEVHWRIPDIAPVEADATIYTAVNLDIYLNNNPNGFLDGAWAVGDSLIDLGISIVDGKVPGLEGVLFATSDFFYDPFSEFGWSPFGGSASLLNSDAYQAESGQNALTILQEHIGVPSPASSLVLAVAGLASCKRRRSHG
ncbi:hypothetical protein JYT11_00335 [Planctomycetaceae bacterium AH-315-I19]|nr:hypothetical protein [Planctomycetaceae bacterium AH-315-I19]